jgi:antitoxin component of MazEF toxin-antitoxin module
MQNQPPLMLRKSGKMGSSVHVTIPRSYMKAHDLAAGDLVYWEADSDGIKLRFRRAKQAYTQPVLEPNP